MLLLLVVGTGRGLQASHKLHDRVFSLERLAYLADRLAECVRSTAAPLSSLLSELSQSAELSMLPLWEEATFSDNPRGGFCVAVKAHAGEMGLDAEDARLLTEFIDGWGEADVAGEVERCRQYAARFGQRCESAREKAQRMGSLYVTLGICGGGAAALLLGG